MQERIFYYLGFTFCAYEQGEVYKLKTVMQVKMCH